MIGPCFRYHTGGLENEFPIYEEKIDYYCKNFMNVAKMGKNTKLGFNEWGIGGMVNGNTYHYALLARFNDTDV